MDVLVQALLALALVPALLGWLERWQAATAALSVLLLAVVAALGLTSDATATWDVGRTLALGLALLLAVSGGGPITTLVFAAVDRQDHSSDVVEAEDVLRGGAWIGALERAGVFATLAAGWPDGLAIVLGLKALGRYPELRNGDNPGTAERFIIGTFTSVLWAAGCAGVAVLVT
ncbi:MAG TPA: hypothetical protein VGJ41_09895 [Nocardioides sp.]|jgi:hypothetical protein